MAFAESEECHLKLTSRRDASLFHLTDSRNILRLHAKRWDRASDKPVTFRLVHFSVNSLTWYLVCTCLVSVSISVALHAFISFLFISHPQPPLCRPICVSRHTLNIGVERSGDKRLINGGVGTRCLRETGKST